MRVTVLASGSKGNCTYIEDNNTKVLIDLGMSSTYVENKLKGININPKDIDGILITHIHTDHIAGLSSFCKKYNTPIFISPTMEDDLRLFVKQPVLYYLKKEMNIKNIEIKVIKTSHDTESYGYILNDKLVYITDTGYINEKYFDMLKNKNIYIFESNHDVEMLMNGKYPYYIKQRVVGDRGHLSNKDSSYYLSKLVGDKTQCIILAHLSEENNTKEKALEACLTRELDKCVKIILVADRKERTELVEV